MLTLSSVFKTFNKGKENETSALNGVSLSFPDKGLFVILGPSGSGKSTLLSLIGALDKPDEGTIIYNDLDVEKMNEKEANIYRQSIVSFIFQDYNLVDYLSLKDNALLKSNKSVEEVEQVLKDLDIARLAKKKPNTLSGGEKERCAIARALLADNKILLCDEPTASLDMKNANNVLSILKKVSEDKLVIVVSHDEVLCQKYTDNIIHIRDGVIEAQKIEETNSKDESSQEISSNKAYRSDLFKRVLYHIKHKIGESSFVMILSLVAFFSISMIVGLATGTREMVNTSVNGLIHLSPITVSSYYDNITTNGLISEPKTDYVSGININQERELTTSLHKNIITNEFIDYLVDNPLKDTYFAINNDQAYSFIYKDEKDGAYYLKDNHSIDSLNDYVETFLGKQPVVSELVYTEKYFNERFEWLDGHFPQNDNEAILVYRQHHTISEDIAMLLNLKNGEDPASAIGKKLYIPNHEDIYSEIDSLAVTGRFLKDQETLEKSNQDLRAINNYYVQYLNSYYNGDVKGQNAAKEVINNLFESEEETRTLKAYGRIQNSTKLKQLVEQEKVNSITISGIAKIPDNTPFGDKLNGILIPSKKLQDIREKNSQSAIAKEIDSHIVMPSASSSAFPRIYGYLNLVNTSTSDSIEDYVLNFIDFFENRKFFSTNNEISAVEVFAPDLKTKDYYAKKIDAYNKTKDDCYQMKYLDFTKCVVGYFNTYLIIFERSLYIISIATLIVSALLSLAIFLNMALSRTKEIGILKACGYSRTYIFGLLEIEALIFGAISGSLGVLFANLCQRPICNYLGSQKTDVILSGLFHLTPLWSGIIIACSIFASFLAALIPAILLSKKKPIDTLKG